VPGRSRTPREGAVVGAFDHDSRRAATHRSANDTAQITDSHHTVADVKFG